MADNNLNDDSLQSVRTPWGDLAKSQGIQSSLNSVKDELTSINQRIRTLEQQNNSSEPTSPMNEAVLKTLSAKIDSVQHTLEAFDKRINDLEKSKPLPSLGNQSPAGNSQEISALESRITNLEIRVRDMPKPSSSSRPTGVSAQEFFALEAKLAQVENRIHDLEAKFEKFSTKTLQILEQLRKGPF